MEILLTPKDPITPPEAIPFVCGDLRYDFGPFLTYPDRLGRGRIANPSMVLGGMPDYIRMQEPEGAATLEPHLQTWLLFGLLAEWLGINATGDQEPSESAKGALAMSLYEKFVYERDGSEWITLEPLFPLMRESMEELIATKDGAGFEKERYLHLGVCIQHASHILATCKADFDPRIRYSIGAVGETLVYSIVAIYKVIGVPKIIGSTFARNFLSADRRKSMVEKGGWCPSDISRVQTNYNSLHALNLLSKLDRTASGRVHTGCSENECLAYQIDMETYSIGHTAPDCSCGMTVVEEEETTRVLRTPDSFPLLSINSVNDNHSEDVEVKVVESTAESRYVAISHVWADGLGNPNENALHSCRVKRLHQLVQTMNPTADSDTPPISLIWLDTFCCPVKSTEGKNASLTKIHQVYENAFRTLVLDTSLQSISSEGLSMWEMLCRIFTCSWMRRLWTLQEAALSKSLWFRFKDKSIFLDDILRQMYIAFNKDIPLRGIVHDLMQENRMIRIFFHYAEQQLKGPDLAHLDHALKHRSVSVASDEALCIATLMGFPTSSIVERSGDDRMQQIWSLLAFSHQVPAQIIFLMGERLGQPGWRWAPKSLLGEKGNVRDLMLRGLHLRNEQFQTPTPYGLRVNFSGIRFSTRRFDDGLPRHPWKAGLNRPVESYVMFRDASDRWYRIADTHQLSSAHDGYYRYSDADNAVWKEKMGPYPLHDILETGKAAVIFPNELTHEKGSASGLLVNVDQEIDGGLAVRRLSSVIVAGVDKGEYIIWDTIERCATKLRRSELTETVVALRNPESEAKDAQSEEYRIALRAVIEEMKVVMQEAIDSDPVFVKAIEKWLDDDLLSHMWKYIGEWYNEDIVGEILPVTQTWFVD